MDPFVFAVVSPAQDFNVLVDILPVVHSGCLCDSLRPSSSSAISNNLAPKPWGSDCTLKNCFHSAHSKSSNSNTGNGRLKHGRVRWITEDIQGDKRNSDHSHTRHCNVSRLTFAGSSTSMIRFDFNHQASPYLAINDYRLSHTYPNMQPPSIRRENRRKAASASPFVDRCCSHPNHSTAAQTLATAVRKIPSLTLPRTILINPDYPESTRRKTRLGSTSSSSSTTNIELEKRKKQLSSSLAAPKPPLKSVMDTNISFKLCWLEQPSFLVQPTKSLDIVRRASENGIMELKKHRQKQMPSSSNKSKNPEDGNGVVVRQSPKSTSGLIHTDTHTSFTQQYMLKPPRATDIETNTTCSSDSIHSIITINSPWGTNC